MLVNECRSGIESGDPDDPIAKQRVKLGNCSTEVMGHCKKMLRVGFVGRPVLR
jgi:hypothetical protein